MSKKQYSLPPIVGLVVYSSDTVVQRARQKTNPKPKPKRGEIVEFSDNARKRLAFVASNTDVNFQSMVTLTYPSEFPCDGKVVKRHLYQFLAWLKQLMPGVNYLWFLEFQKRGAPHVHMLLDRQPASYGGTWPSFQFAVANTWYNLVGSHDVRHLRAGTRSERLRTPEGGKHYAVKYAQKMAQKKVPDTMHNVGRFYGYSYPVRPKAKAVIPATWQQVREILGDWKYLPDNEDDLNRVLFNTSGAIAVKAVQEELPIFAMSEL